MQLSLVGGYQSVAVAAPLREISVGSEMPFKKRLLILERETLISCTYSCIQWLIRMCRDRDGTPWCMGAMLSLAPAGFDST